MPAKPIHYFNQDVDRAFYNNTRKENPGEVELRTPDTDTSIPIVHWDQMGVPVIWGNPGTKTLRPFIDQGLSLRNDNRNAKRVENTIKLYNSKRIQNV